MLDSIDVLINVGDADTAHTGGSIWEDADVVSAIKGFIHRGGGFIGVGEPAGHQYEGRFLQLAGVMGVEKETGFTLNYDKYNCCLLYTSIGTFATTTPVEGVNIKEDVCFTMDSVVNGTKTVDDWKAAVQKSCAALREALQ